MVLKNNLVGKDHSIINQHWSSTGTMNLLLITDNEAVRVEIEQVLNETELVLDCLASDEVKQLFAMDKELSATCVFIDDSLAKSDLLSICSTLIEQSTEHILSILLLIDEENQQNVLEEAFEIGIFDFIKKPIEKWDLLGRLNAMWHLHRESMNRRKNEAAMNDLLEQFRLNISALKAAANAITITDRNGRIAWVNPYFTKLTGYAEHEAVGKNMRILKSSVHTKEFYQQLWDTITSGKVWRGQITNRRKDGIIYHEEMSITPVYNKLGIITHFISIKEDITERKEMEQQRLDDLQVAKRVQQSALSLPFEDEEIDFSAIYLPSSELAGDMYSWFKIDETKYGVIVLDVMGHGVPSSLVSMSVRSVVGGFITKTIDPVKVIKELNDHMLELFRHDDSYINHYFTAIYMVVDLKKKLVEVVNAGHPSALLFFDDDELIELKHTAVPVGLFDQYEIKKEQIHYKTNFQGLLYTDGVVDALADDYDEGMQLLKKHYDGCKGNSMRSDETIACLERTLKERMNVQTDDICMLHVRIK
ncbi:PP2C family protein-serine/threonine phosphatase [Bacillus solimangrovi]|uniref:Histidine kinase n=1 Tax=Bacillus solimangrovi TaxID=1305675 RepID=A0A1E5LJF6_9BACI|nr:PP2C family protein-serine/threonine phosphatase [Bacillus solimangrovi]OEH94214.1 hypothetical protein BFG57_09180 [Bacillus solimangrovi]